MQEQLNPQVQQLVNEYGFENYTSAPIEIKAVDEEEGKYSVSKEKVKRSFVAIQERNRKKMQRDVAMYDEMTKSSNLPKQPPVKRSFN